MATFRLKKCVFIVKLFERRPLWTQTEIMDAMREEFPHDDAPSPRTFGRYKEFIEDNFPCKLVFDQHTKQYHLEKSKQTNDDNNIYEYIMAMYNVIGLEPLLSKHSDKVHNAEIVTGTEKLEIILKAIDEHKGYICDYHSFNNETTKTRTFIPLFLTSWEGRWYVVADVTTHPDGTPYTYALERMDNIQLTKEKMKPFSKVNIREYFKDAYGIQHHSEEDQPQDIVIRATGSQVEYLKARPIHSSQKIVEEGKGYCIFLLHLTPCFNFYQQLLWHRETLEVLDPQSVRDELKEIIHRLDEIYK